MSSEITVNGVGKIVIVRNPRAKSVRIKINHDGQPEISAPKYVPVYVIKKFAESKIDWINKHKRESQTIDDGSTIGKYHIVKVVKDSKFSIKIGKEEIRVSMPESMSLSDKEVQEKLRKKATETLRKQAKELLAPKVELWARTGVGNYNEVTIKLIKARWGSYSSNGNISLSLFMAQLPDDLIDYIIVHELSHSVHMNHSKSFWEHVAKYIPDYKDKRKRLRSYNMTVIAN